VASLGTFAAAAREYDPDAHAPDTFEFCGETFTVRGTVPSMLHLMVAAAWIGKISAFDGDAALYEALRHALTVPEHTVDGKTIPADISEWDRFYRLAIDRNVEGEWLTAILFNIMAAEDARPTVRRSTSSSGSSPTGTSSSSSASDSPA
jgi:hypothetical protein